MTSTITTSNIMLYLPTRPNTTISVVTDSNGEFTLDVSSNFSGKSYLIEITACVINSGAAQCGSCIVFRNGATFAVNLIGSTIVMAITNVSAAGLITFNTSYGAGLTCNFNCIFHYLS
jgi:hypothetical protein